MPCPMCFEKFNVVDAADESCAVGEDYTGHVHLPELRHRARQGGPLLHGARHARMALAAEVPDPRQDGGRPRLLDAGARAPGRGARRDRWTSSATPIARGRRRDPPVIDDAAGPPLRLVTPARLAAYLERRGWTIDEGGTRRDPPDVGEAGRRGLLHARDPRGGRRGHGLGRRVRRPRRGLLGAGRPRRACSR